jgi:hypothetical protein
VEILGIGEKVNEAIRKELRRKRRDSCQVSMNAGANQLCDNIRPAKAVFLENVDREVSCV